MDACDSMARAASASSVSDGGSISCGAGPRSFAAATMSTTIAAPTVALRKRGASPETSNCHQSSCEYSTCLKAKKPSQTEAAMAATTAALQAGDIRVSNSAALRSNAGLACFRSASSTVRMIASSTSAPFSNDAAIPMPIATVAKWYAASRRRATPWDSSSRAAPTRLPAKWDVSTTPRGTNRLIHSSRPSAAGVAPENSRTIPAKNVRVDSTRGVSCSASLAINAAVRAACTRRWRTSSKSSPTSATESGSR